MMRPGNHALLLAALASSLAVADHSVAATDEYKIIVHPENTISAVDRAFVRDVYLRKATDWGGGAPARPIDLATRFTVRERFCEDVLRKTPAQLKRYWSQQIFSGKGVPPPEADSTAAAVA